MGIYDKQYLRAAPYAAALLPICILYYVVYSNAVNIPFSDDYDLILGSAMAFLDAHSIGEKVDILFSQHNEHRLAFARAVTLASFYITGNIDMRVLMYIGNLSLIGIAAILLFSVEKGKYRIMYFVPVSFIVFQPQYWESTQCAGGALSNMTGLAFAMLSIYMAADPGKRNFALSALSAVAAVFTHAVGLFVVPVCFGIFVFQKRRKEMIWWLLIMASVAGFYFTGYMRLGHHPAMMDAILADPGNTARYLITLLGSPLAVAESKSLIYALGITSLSLMAFLTVKKYYLRNARNYSLLVFLFIAALLVTLSRSGFGIIQALSNRYRMIPLLIVALECLAVMELLGAEKAKRFLPVLIVLTLVFNVVSFKREYEYVKWHRIRLATGALEYMNSGTGLDYPDQSHAGEVLARAGKMKVYEFPDFYTLVRWAELKK